MMASLKEKATLLYLPCNGPFTQTQKHEAQAVEWDLEHVAKTYSGTEHINVLCVNWSDYRENIRNTVSCLLKIDMFSFPMTKLLHIILQFAVHPF